MFAGRTLCPNRLTGCDISVRNPPSKNTQFTWVFLLGDPEGNTEVYFAAILEKLRAFLRSRFDYLNPLQVFGSRWQPSNLKVQDKLGLLNW